MRRAPPHPSRQESLPDARKYPKLRERIGYLGSRCDSGAQRQVLNELDRYSKDAQDMLLIYLDRMKPGHAFLGTNKLDLGSLTERI